MGLSIGPNNFESLALGDTPLEALMLGEVELWSAVSPPAGVEPQAWGSTTPVSNPNNSTNLVSYTATASGAITLSGTIVASAVNYNYTGEVQHFAYIYKNGTVIGSAGKWGASYANVTVTATASTSVVAGDVITFRANVAGGLSRVLNSWSFSLDPMVVNITSTAVPQARDQFRAALTSVGLSFTTVETIPFQLNTSTATNLSSMFSDCAKLKTVPPMNTANTTQMQNMFYDCFELTSVPDLQTAKVLDARNMFWRCGKLTDGNVRLIGKHPSLNAPNITYQSGLTRAPFFDANGNPI